VVWSSLNEKYQAMQANVDEFTFTKSVLFWYEMASGMGRDKLHEFYILFDS
jgi:hypothetical protein